MRSQGHPLCGALYSPAMRQKERLNADRATSAQQDILRDANLALIHVRGSAHHLPVRRLALDTFRNSLSYNL